MSQWDYKIDQPMPGPFPFPNSRKDPGIEVMKQSFDLLGVNGSQIIWQMNLRGKRPKKVGYFWPLNHAGKKTLIDKSGIRGLPVMSQYGIDAAGLQG